MRAADFMTQPPITINEEETLEHAAQLMIDKGIDSLPVVDAHGELRGILTTSDFASKEADVPYSIFRAPQLFGQWLTPGGVEAIYRSARATPVRAIMTAPAVTCSEQATLDDLVATLVGKKVHHVVVVRGGKPVGIVARHDLLRAMSRLMALA